MKALERTDIGDVLAESIVSVIFYLFFFFVVFWWHKVHLYVREMKYTLEVHNNFSICVELFFITKKFILIID